MPFAVGKGLLIDILQGNESKAKVKRHKFSERADFGVFVNKGKDEIVDMIEPLVGGGFLVREKINGNAWAKVLKLSPKGSVALKNPESVSSAKGKYDLVQEEVSEDERKLIQSFGFFLDRYNEEQCKAIVCDKREMLCIAGAGSGKTTVLTKRIEFLCKFRSVQPEKILAITFTKKARKEMQERLVSVGGVEVQTFNSFCEKIIQRHGNIIYTARKEMLQYKDKIRLVLEALSLLGMRFSQVADSYFTFGQRRGKPEDKLLLSFVNDCFYVLEYYTLEEKSIERFYEQMSGQEQMNAKILHQICVLVQQAMERKGLRTYSDQLRDVVNLFERCPALIPQFEHILVDEYQDVNHIQIKLLSLLAGKNLFVVGDPRQAIFGWRGSKMDYLLKFKETYPEAAVVALKKNYRSTPMIVNLANKIVSGMGIADLEVGREEEEFSGKKMEMLKFNSAIEEKEFVLREILGSEFVREEIFVLARTNKQLKELGELLKKNKILFTLAGDEKKAQVRKGYVVLSTVHAIKGLEAEQVFVMGCSSQHFPCKVSDHPVIESLGFYTYDKEEEERRLLYVALTRAKQVLYVSYSSKNPTYFLSNGCRKLFEGVEKIKEIPKVVKVQQTGGKHDVYGRLRTWRASTSQKLGVPAYMILHDKSLIELSQKMPLHKEELLHVYGIGPTKIMKYGEEILQVVSGC